MQDAANALMAELATIDQHGFSAEELDDVKSTRLTWLKNAVDQQAERDLRMLTSRLASSSLNNTAVLVAGRDISTFETSVAANYRAKSGGKNGSS
ncbi:membrane-associated peptidase [Escherichia coli]|uniref:Membrane-associated peptidase n=1 Tax=Escherichia coli TaxID=562 RepID=A0A2X1MTV3_ECOLX|nr:membrane-associated peptidase [Escherichia coli]